MIRRAPISTRTDTRCPYTTLFRSCACADVWAEEGEGLATGIGIIPRIAQGLAKLTRSPQLMITDGEAYLVEEPAVIGAKNHEGRSYAGWMPYSRVFESLWHGRRHALVGPEIGRASWRDRGCQYV